METANTQTKNANSMPVSAHDSLLHERSEDMYVPSLEGTTLPAVPLEPSPGMQFARSAGRKYSNIVETRNRRVKSAYDALPVLVPEVELSRVGVPVLAEGRKVGWNVVEKLSRPGFDKALIHLDKEAHQGSFLKALVEPLLDLPVGKFVAYFGFDVWEKVLLDVIYRARNKVGTAINYSEATGWSITYLGEPISAKRREVLEALRNDGPMTVPEIASHLSILDVTAAHHRVDFLLKNRLIRCDPMTSPRLYTFFDPINEFFPKYTVCAAKIVYTDCFTLVNEDSTTSSTEVS